jgi:hypothetical protein
MVLLRISDYLQVEADRAPRQLLQVKRLWSPFSLGKWREHQAVRDIRTTHEDPEAIFVDALPLDVDRYLALKELLSGIQKELDDSWAVLGEVYGRWEGLKGLGLTSRRVRSTIDNEETFGRSVDYVPRRASFEAASGDLIPLLVEPLYGDRPEIGVRELIQNSVDAVRESWRYRELRQIGAMNTKQQDITIEVKTDLAVGSWLTVEDHGIGMTIDTVCSYLLRVGASFRRSDLWRKTFEAADGRSLVLRSGRFGIGVLAAFLLGEELEVSTRHADSAEGICFSATLGTNNIELRKCQRPVGTTIRARLSEKALKVLAKEEAWDWYCLSEPKVVRRMLSHKAIPRTLRQRHVLPSSGVHLPRGWHRVRAPGYEDIQWTYLKIPGLVCNGIRVRHLAEASLWRAGYSSDGWSISTPNLSIFDPDGRFPLNLDRTAMTQKGLPFQEELLDDVVRDFIAFAALEAPRSRWSPMSSRYPGLREPHLAWFHSPTGTGVLTKHNFQAAREGGGIVAVPYSLTRTLLEQENISIHSPVIWLNLDSRKHIIDSWIRKALGAIPDNFLWQILDPAGVRILVSKEWASRLRNGGPSQRLPRGPMAKIRREKAFSQFELWSSGACPASLLDFQEISHKAGSLSEALPIVLAEFYPASSSTSIAPTSIDLLWQRYVGQPTIPYDLDQRLGALKDTFTELQAYIEAHKIKPVGHDELEALEPTDLPDH